MTDRPSPPAASRRRFLKTSAALAATAPFAAGAYAGGGDVLRVGLIGCGGRGTGAATNALNADGNVKLVAMGDVFADRIQSSLATLRREGLDSKLAVTPENCFTGLDAYKNVIANSDVVLLATPPGFRPEHLKAAVEAGKHVFCEKPMAVDAPGVRYRYEPSKRETVKRIHDGAIGDVMVVQSNYLTNPVWVRERQPGWTDLEYQLRNWYYFTWLSGDHIVEQHIHSLDKAAWVLRDEYPVEAIGIGGRQVRTEPKYGHIYDHFSVVFRYASGAKVFSCCRQLANCPTDVSDHIFGTKGTCQLMKHAIHGEQKWQYRGEAPSMYQVEHNELFAGIRAGKVLNDGEFMAKSTMMGIMGRMAAYTGQLVTWERAMKSEEVLAPSTLDWHATLPTPPVARPGVTKLV
jgi:predicted dehydrogenase